MEGSSLRTRRFNITFLGVALVWSSMHLAVLRSFGFSWYLAGLDSAISNIFLFAICLLVTIITEFYIPQKNSPVYLFSLSAILSLIWLFLSRSFLCLVLDESEYRQFFGYSLPIRLAIGFLIIGCSALLSVLWYTVQDHQASEKRKGEAEKLSREAELYKLRQQLQPHFLFNSLNSINALISSQPAKARNMIQQLSHFLRGTLRKEETAWTSLEEELEHLQLYLEIEKVRFGHRLNTTIANETAGMRLPSMLLQPVLENAIKFGLYDTTGDITISLQAVNENGYLKVTVINPFDPQTSLPRKGTGFGLSSVQRRLYLLFARNDLLHTDSKGDQFYTTIVIPQVYD